MLQWTSRFVPIVEIGVGVVYGGSGSARWGSARWGQDRWVKSEPTWLDVSCDVMQVNTVTGRTRATDRFEVGRAEILVDNSSGWADLEPPVYPDMTAAIRPGREVRVGVFHVDLGACWLFRGEIDELEPRYDPAGFDTLMIRCVDALGSAGRAKFEPLVAPVGDGETATQRVTRVLDRCSWPDRRRDVAESSTTMIASDLAGQAIDLLRRASDSVGGAVFGDNAGRIVFRNRDWQTYLPDAPPDGTLGNYSGDVCPSGYLRPWRRGDMATRVLLGREAEPISTVVDSIPGIRLFGVEPYQLDQLWTETDAALDALANRLLKSRGYENAPRAMTALFDAGTGDDVVDLGSTVDIFRPSRYRVRLATDRGDLFDDQFFATGLRHELTGTSWTFEVDLDLASGFAATGGRWGSARWNRSTWATAP